MKELVYHRQLLPTADRLADKRAFLDGPYEATFGEHVINELENARLAKRRRRPGDRRAWEVSITPNGRRTLERARRLVAQVEDEVLGGLTAADRRQLLVLLRRALASAPTQPPWRLEEGG
jgi:hypothetical protein